MSYAQAQRPRHTQTNPVTPSMDDMDSSAGHYGISHALHIWCTAFTRSDDKTLQSTAILFFPFHFTGEIGPRNG